MVQKVYMVTDSTSGFVLVLGLADARVGVGHLDVRLTQSLHLIIHYEREPQPYRS